MKTLIKNGDSTLVVDTFDEHFVAVKNRTPSMEAGFAMVLIERLCNATDIPPGAVVERAFDIARLTYKHIKDNRMDAPFPFAKVYPDDQENG